MDGIPGGQALRFKTSGFGTPMKMVQIIHQACIKTLLAMSMQLCRRVTFSARKIFLMEMEGKGISTGIGPPLDPRYAEILTSMITTRSLRKICLRDYNPLVDVIEL
ncbi:uncharacterized protein Bfra_009423 [Botrytis fragariae]|uniref:Uncharacterized protein n=1 Tax=Botrytis fragariae TaxID=1964551 RepID=A0A8H6AP20_9HELO|nr:uncharacterized protein Bfra_009423 [Botrytis fragariae]KAF5870868.1 hypothetical protein Bfra_009423 [Botrytis fragariae]